MFFKRDFKPERRHGRRQLLNTSVQVFTGSLHLEAIGINLSEVGMCLFTVTNLPLGTRVEVEFLPPESKKSVRVAGIVRHRALYLYGIEFLETSDPNASAWVDADQNSDETFRPGTPNSALSSSSNSIL